MYKPVVFKLPEGKDNFLIDNKNNVKLSTSICKPKISLGFHYFIHRTKSSMSITNKLNTKNKFWNVVNPFEHIISDYDDNLSKYSSKYFNDKSPKILSRAFYKLWEMIILFELAEKDKMVIASLAEGPGAFIQAVINYRKKIKKKINNDKLFGVTIHPEGNYLEMGKQFMSYYKKNHPKLLNIHKTYPKKETLKYKNRDNGDITTVKTISNFKKLVTKNKKYADLVTADGGFYWNDENYQEQEAYQLIFGEIVAALKVQAKGGSFVLKIFESFTEITIKMIYLLSSFYDECYIHKPYFSRESNSEKYVICKKFKYEQNNKFKNKLKILEEMLENMTSNEFISDIFPNLLLPEKYLNIFKFININIANNQQIMINKIVKFIKDNDYYGDKYHEYRNNQIEAVKWWKENFFVDENDLKKNKTILIKNLEDRIKFNNSELNIFIKKLV